MSEDIVKSRHVNIFDLYRNYQNVSLNGGLYQDLDKMQYIVDAPLSLNLYTYTYNNPIKYADPSGNIIIADDAIILVVVLVVFIAVAVTTWYNSPHGKKAREDLSSSTANGFGIIKKIYPIYLQL